MEQNSKIRGKNNISVIILCLMITGYFLSIPQLKSQEIETSEFKQYKGHVQW